MLRKFQESCCSLILKKPLTQLNGHFYRMSLNVLISARLFGIGSLHSINSDVESAVISGGYTSNFFQISRGVRQGCPLSPLLFVLGAEILAQKIRQSPGCRGIELPQSVEAKISQFADATTPICWDTDALKENMKVLNDFRDISGPRLNK